jgi:hypothetical protein
LHLTAERVGGWTTARRREGQTWGADVRGATNAVRTCRSNERGVGQTKSVDDESTEGWDKPGDTPINRGNTTDDSD